MNLLLHKFKSLGLGIRVFNESDFYLICEREKIRVIETDQPFTFWLCLDGKEYIVINRNLRGFELLFTMYHELAHHFLHHGTELQGVKAFNANNSREEIEADWFATVAVYPPHLLETGEYIEYEEFDPFLYQIRRRAEAIYSTVNL